MPKAKRKAYLLIIWGIVIALWSLWTWQRNELWSNDLAFLYDQVAKAPDKVRPYCNLTASLNQNDLFEESLELLEKIGQKEKDLPAECIANKGFALYYLKRPG